MYNYCGSSSRGWSALRLMLDLCKLSLHTMFVNDYVLSLGKIIKVRNDGKRKHLQRSA